jgi:cytidylate kinase
MAQQDDSTPRMSPPRMTTRMRAVTISREYGSGGGEIARRLATRLGWQLVDHEVVAQVARELGMSLDEAAEHDERAEGFAERLLASLQVIEPNVLINPPLAHLHDAQAYHAAVCRVVEAAAGEGQVVIVGRAGQMVLRQRRDVLHVRIVAPLAQRIQYVARRERLDEAAARARIQEKEVNRARYMQVFYRTRPDDPHLYDLSVNTAILSLDDAVALIAQGLDHKAARLAIPEAQLGPGAGLAPYPARPEDFPLSPKPEL